MPHLFESNKYTLDHLESYGLDIWQPQKGYRFSLDALLLAEFVELKPRDRIIDLGTGCGIIALLLAQKGASNIHAVEIQPELANLAEKNVAVNNLSAQIRVVEADLKELRNIYKAGSFDKVVSNPPYRPVGTGRICPDKGEACARHEILATLKDILNISKYLLPPGGSVNIIYPADRLAVLIYQMKQLNLEPKRLQSIYPATGQPARLVMIEGRKDAGEELTVMEPKFINQK